jgi:protein-S-isoprenylcysteine O-methyltransferase Ste14
MSSTDDPGARSSTDELFVDVIPISDRRSLILSTCGSLSNWPDSVQTESADRRAVAAHDSDRLARLGGWLFRYRTALPLPVAIAILTLRIGEAPPTPALVGGGIALTAIGEALRLWGVRHIGAISRTRSDRVGPLVDQGPFAIVRNPLYVGNVALWVGFALTARLAWLALATAVLLAAEYHAIVRWEERLLEERLGEGYREYASRVPRWMPELPGPAPNHKPAGRVARRGWRETLFSERGTLIAIACGYLLLWIKARF